MDTVKINVPIFITRAFHYNVAPIIKYVYLQYILFCREGWTWSAWWGHCRCRRPPGPGRSR